MSLNGKQPEAMPTSDEEREVGAFLRRWRDPAPDPAAKARLLEILSAEMNTAGAHHDVPLQNETRRQRLTWAWLILRAQARLVHPATWAASGLVIALGALVTLLLYQPTQTGADLPLVIVAPLAAACGVAFLYGLDADPALELQLSTPISPRLILLARLLLLFAFNLTITFACSLILSLMQAQISLMPLIGAWLAPMTFLSALAFLLSVLFFDPLASVLICLLLWTALALRHFLDQSALALPDLLRASAYPAMWIAAPALIVLALWLAEREERWTQGGSH